MTDNILPEEKLLRLIKGGKNLASNASGADNSEEYSKRTKKREKFPQINFNYGKFSLRRISVLLLIFSLLYLLSSFIYPMFNQKTIEISKSEKNAGYRITKKELPAIAQKPLTHYLEATSAKKIFKNPSLKEPAGPVGAASADLIRDINLVGIISGPEPQAIVEDKKAQKTYYLRKGQYIGELQLEDILTGKIILNYNGQKFELYL
jgi:type II secretory pathway component PulC